MIEHPADYYRTEAREHWEQARRKARAARIAASIPGEHTGLLDFNDIAAQLGLKHAVYRGVQTVPLDSIVGSAGRYKDFTGAFLPVDDSMSSRWQRIAAIYLDPTSGGVPPVELYKVGTAYFVKDGNHRVSVARQLDLKDIEAYVWEYPEPVSDVGPEADIDTLLIEAERREFLEKTQLDTLRPGHGIWITAPGGYRTLLFEIAQYQHALSLIDSRPVGWEEAVGAWYDMVYEITVQLIQKTGVLHLFPERTPADFFVWIRKHQQELEERYGRRVMVRDAARDFGRRNRTTLPERAAREVLRWIVGRLG